MLAIFEVHQGCLGEVVVGQLEVSDLGGDDRLSAGRERGVAHCELLVVVEVARLLLGGEGVAERVQRQDQVSLLHDLLSVQVEVVGMKHQRVALRAVASEVPPLVLGEALGLLVDAERLVEGEGDRRGRVAPRGGLLRVDA